MSCLLQIVIVGAACFGDMFFVFFEGGTEYGINGIGT